MRQYACEEEKRVESEDEYWFGSVVDGGADQTALGDGPRALGTGPLADGRGHAS